ncbi:MAG: hypothetical protein JRF40_12850 [Deltaproteobacteria bacterium]|nr:hypothetical protein [Deltaproteobacteria bacterium]
MDRNPNLAAGLIFKKKKSIIFTKKKDVFRDLNVYSAVIYYLSYSSLLPPSKRLEAVRAFFYTECFCGQMIKGKSISKPLMNFFKDVDGIDIIKIKVRVAAQHFIIKTFDIKADNCIKF